MTIAISFKIFLLFTFFINSLPLIYSTCEQPQKGFFLSFNALSKRDTMPDVFKEIDTKFFTYSVAYKDEAGVHYELANISPKLYYNEHPQKETFLSNSSYIKDSTHVNVTLGQVYLNLHFDYLNGGTKKLGSAQSTVLLNDAYFIKEIYENGGYLEWNPTEFSELYSTLILSIKNDYPKLNQDEKQNFELMLNDHVGDKKIKTTIEKDMNVIYKQILKKHLNNEQMIGDQTIDYKYKNINFTFTNKIKNSSLHNDEIKGLEVFFLFELDGHTTECTQDFINFEAEGGVQEWYSKSTLFEVWKYSLTQGILNVNLDRKWEVQSFQFYAGDLANSVPFLEKFNSELPFGIACQWTENKNETKLRITSHDLFTADAETICTINFQGKDIISTTFTITFTIRVIAQEDYLQFKMIGASAYYIKFKSLDPNYEVKNPSMGEFAINELLKGLDGTEVLGTNWKTSKRKFPSVKMTADYMIVFDPSVF